MSVVLDKRPMALARDLDSVEVQAVEEQRNVDQDLAGQADGLQFAC